MLALNVLALWHYRSHADVCRQAKCCQPPTQRTEHRHVVVAVGDDDVLQSVCPSPIDRGRERAAAAAAAKKFPFSVELGTSSLVNVLQFCGPRALHILRYSCGTYIAVQEEEGCQPEHCGKPCRVGGKKGGEHNNIPPYECHDSFGSGRV